MLSDYSVKRIDYRLAMKIIVERHYLHRTCPCSMAFGLCDSKNDIYGVVTYGVPCSSTLLRGMEGKHHATFAHGMTMRQVIEKYGEDSVEYVERPRKHRYVYFNASPKRKKALRRKLLYRVMPYPKGDSSHADECWKEPERYIEQLSIF